MRIETGDVIIGRNMAVFFNGRAAYGTVAADEAAGYIDVHSLDKETMCPQLDLHNEKVRTHRRFGRVNLVGRG